MKTTLKNVKIKSFITVAIVFCISFGLGYYTAYKINAVNERPDAIKRISTNVQILKSMDTTSNTNKAGNSEDDPLIHLKMLQDDVKTFKALMEEVKNELFVTDNA